MTELQRHAYLHPLTRYEDANQIGFTRWLDKQSAVGLTLNK